MNGKFKLIALMLISALAFTTAADPCPAVVHAEFAASKPSLTQRVLSYLTGAGVSADKSLFTEAHSVCPGQDVVVNGRFGRVVAVRGYAFSRDHSVRERFGVPAHAENLLREDDARVKIKTDDGLEFLPTREVAVSGRTLWYPSLTADGEDGQIDEGAAASDCRGPVGVFHRVFARPGQLIRAPGEQLVQIKGRAKLIPVRDLCVELPISRRARVRIATNDPKLRHGLVIRYRGLDQVDVRYPDHRERTFSRRQIL